MVTRTIISDLRRLRPSPSGKRMLPHQPEPWTTQSEPADATLFVLPGGQNGGRRLGQELRLQLQLEDLARRSLRQCLHHPAPARGLFPGHPPLPDRAQPPPPPPPHRPQPPTPSPPP